MSNTTLNMPNPATPLIGPDGRLSQVWFQFFVTIFTRSGGTGSVPDIATLLAQIDAQEAQIGELFELTNANASAIMLGALLSKVAYLEKVGSAQVASVQRIAPDLPGPVPVVVHSNADLPGVVPAVRPASPDLPAPVYAPTPYLYPRSAGTAGQMLLSSGPNAAAAWSNAPTITGGTIDGAPIGNGTPSSAIVTTLQSNGTYAQFKDSGSIFMRATASTNKNAWRLTWGMSGSADGSLTIQHSTDNYAANFLNAMVLSTSTVAVGLPLVLSQTTLLQTSVALANGAAAAAGTLTNAPTAGNPTKWIPINDNGTTRYLPAW